MVQRLVLVALGGALGSVLRYLTALAVARWLGADFPWGTLLVNLVGSFLIGVVHELGADALVLPAEARIFLATGVLGGLTTYSAFSHETARLIEAHAWPGAAIYVIVTTAACVGLCLLGMSAVRYAAR